MNYKKNIGRTIIVKKDFHQDNQYYKKGDRIKIDKYISIGNGSLDGKKYSKEPMYHTIAEGDNGAYWIFARALLTEDECGGCTSSCRRESGKCSLYSEK
jgi:hypothetical protein